jgi:hypothetical protein
MSVVIKFVILTAALLVFMFIMAKISRGNEM